jgi:uncharacterized membrane protein YdbT with pleckstrin-like domain
METIRKQLVEGEHIIHASYLHPAIFLQTGLVLFLALLVGVFFHPFVGCVILLLALPHGVASLIRFKTMRLVLTNKRVLARFGYFNKDQVQFKLERIESAYLEEPLLGQYLGYSTTIVKGTGSGSLVVDYVADGGVFIKKLEELTLNQPKTVAPTTAAEVAADAAAG